MRTIGLLHPGEMGSALGRALRDGGLDVVWASEGRSPATAQRAADADLRDVGTADRMAGVADVILSVCPPHAAADVAAAVADYRGLYVDANAVAPATVRRIEASLPQARFVDGGIVGPPPTHGDGARLYLSGAGAPEIAALLAGTDVDARVLGDRIGDASALKMAYAAWSKGTAAMLLSIRELARTEGVEGPLLEEWRLSVAGLEERSEQAARSAATKGWRWIGEMEEIAATFAANGLPDGFHRAAAEIYRRGKNPPKG